MIVKALLPVFLLASSSSTIVVPGEYDPITEVEIEQKAAACIAIFQQKVSWADIAYLYNLDTRQKQRDFVVGCGLLNLGYKMGDGTGIKV